MTHARPSDVMVTLDRATLALVRLSARIAAGTEGDVRAELAETREGGTPAVWVEELILQAYLFCGFPRALNAAREWRRSSEGAQGAVQGAVQGVVQSAVQGGAQRALSRSELERMGEETCARVYGAFYEKLRHNITGLHPELDDWMIVEGYGKVLSRPQLDLGRRELCIVAACAASEQERQLHSHLHGARNVGVPPDVIGASLEALDGVVAAAALQRARLLWKKVVGQ